jgi:UDP-2,3-diacylglucosamine hydrolase
MNRKHTYFVSDVHLGLQVADPAAREERFVSFLKGLPQETAALYMLGDIWDFWYEYRDVVPKGYVKVFAALMELIDRGVDVYFFPGNHDIWTYSYFESLGMKKLGQPHKVEIGGKTFCLGHGDGLGPTPFGYRCIKAIFNCRPLQVLFSMLHPWFAYRLGNVWSRNSRLSHKEEYRFKGEGEPLYQFAQGYLKEHKVDYFIFGHFHSAVDTVLPDGCRLLMLKDWMSSSPYICFDGTELITDNNR